MANQNGIIEKLYELARQNIVWAREANDPEVTRLALDANKKLRRAITIVRVEMATSPAR